jgi:hypothetical protein
LLDGFLVHIGHVSRWCRVVMCRSREARDGEAGESRGLLGSATAGWTRERREKRPTSSNGEKGAQSRCNCLRNENSGRQTVVGA